MEKLRLALTMFVASALGLLLAIVDTSPNWDDTGISAGALIILCVTFGAIRVAPAWGSALVIGAWIPILNIAKSGNAASVMVLPMALIAGYVGRGLSNLLIRPHAA